LGSATPIAGPTGLVTGGLYRFSHNPQYTASIIGLVGLCIGANSIFTIALSTVMVGAYVMMASAEEDWLKQLYGAPYRDYCGQTARFLDIPGLIALAERRKPLRETS
jgi:protein-S-isoprenylcysteine O-methyltransferase Ste14